MTRYFFDTMNGEENSPDPEGLEFENDDEARFAALDALPDMARETMPGSDRHTFRSSVRDESGRVIYEASLSLQGHWNIAAPDDAEEATTKAWQEGAAARA